MAAVEQMTDPLGAPKIVTGADYMDALSRLGYNVENMNSSLPMYTKAAEAATSLMDQAFNQRLAWDKAQADNKETIAKANLYDSNTDYNQKSMDARLKELDLKNQTDNLNLDYLRATQDTREKDLQYQVELRKNDAALSDATIQGRTDLARLQGADALEKTKKDISDRISAVADKQSALDELDQIQKGAPDFDQQLAQWHTRHLNTINNDATKVDIASELQNVINQHNSLSSVQLMADNRTEVQRLRKDNHLPANADYESVYKDPRLTQQFLIQGHMSEASDEIQELGSQIRMAGGTLPREYQQAWNDISGAWQQITDNQNDDGYDKIYRGGGAGIVTPDGHLRKDIQGKVNYLKAFLAARQAQLAKAKTAEETIKYGGLTGATAESPQIEIQNVIPGTEGLYTGENRYGVPQQAKLAQLTDQLMAAHPDLRPIVQDYVNNKTPENAAKLEAAIRKAQGYQHGGLVRGYQSGGGVNYGAGSAGDPATTAATPFLSTQNTGFLGDQPPSTGTTDTVPAMLTPGEFVLNKDATTAIGAKNLDTINKIGAETVPVQGMKPVLTAISENPLTNNPLTTDPLAVDTSVAAFAGLSQAQQRAQQQVPQLQIKTPQQDAALANLASKATTRAVDIPVAFQRSASTAGRLPMSNLNNYAYPEGAADVNGIDRNIWSNVMSEEGPEYNMDGKHLSVFGLWKDAPGVEGQAFRTIKQYGSNSLQAYNAVTDAWSKLFLGKTQPQKLTSPGMQMLVIADSQHSGGGPTYKIIQQMGGWDAINKMNPVDAINTYSALRAPLWAKNQARVNREREWALAHNGTLTGQEGTQVVGMQSGGMVNPAYNPQSPVQPLAGLTAPMPTDPLQPMYDPSMMMAAPPQPDLTTTGEVFPPPNRPVYSMQDGGYVPQPGANFQQGGEVGGAGSAGGFEGELDQPGGGAAEGQRHRRFHPRIAGQGGMGAQPNIPDPMQKKLAKLSEDFVTGLSSMIKSRPELGGAIMQHAKNLMSATGLSDVRTEGAGGGGSDFLGGSRREQQPMMNPAMMAMSGGEGSSSEEAYT